MKLIITEEQLKLIIESESEGRLMNVPTEILQDKESFDRVFNLYKDNKEKKNYIGIKVVGDINLSGRYGMGFGSNMVGFCKELIEVDGELRVVDNYIVSFPKLKRVDGDMTLSMTEIRELPELEYVGESMYLRYSGIKSLPMLKSVGESLDLENCSIESLPMLKYVGGILNLKKTPLSKTTTEEELRSKINIERGIYL